MLQVRPIVNEEMRRWQASAERIPDPALRELALANLRDARMHVDVATILALLAPPARRPGVIRAQVALEVAYDYLDSLSEEPHEHPVDNGLTLHRALIDSVTTGPAADYYALHERRDDGGYLAALVDTCRSSFAALPSAGAVAPVAARVAADCGEAQSRAHAVPFAGAEQLQAWAEGASSDPFLVWWEAAAGMAASVICMHALIAAAARPEVGPADAVALAFAYLPLCSATTLLDSLDDYERDSTDGSHSFVAYFPDLDVAADRIAAIARHSHSASTPISADRHQRALLIAGCCAFYLSSPTMPPDLARRVMDGLPREVRPLVRAIVAIFRVWRRLKR